MSRAERGERGARAGRRAGSNRGARAARKRLINVVPVRFRTNFVRHDYDAGELMLRPGEDVIVDTPRGPLIARVEGLVERRYLLSDALHRVMRVATPADLEAEIEQRAYEEEAYRFALDRVRERRIDLKLVRAVCMHDRSKLVFYFSAEKRVDFRDLVRDLAQRFRARIEMHQIGVRDGARMVGGIGPCGRELCCSTFLENFAPVSIRMAKDQGLTLNPKKVSGMCGRLMCCLVYEQAIYKRQKKNLPRPRTEVHTALGPAVVRSVDVINERVTVQLADGTRQLLPLAEIAREQPEPLLVDPDALEPAYQWDEARAPKPRENRGRRRRSGSNSRPSKRAPSEPKDDGAQEVKGQGRAPGRRRRRPNTKRGDGPDPRARTAPGSGPGARRRSRKKEQPDADAPQSDAPSAEGEKPRRRRRRGARKRGPKQTGPSSES